MCRSKFFKTGMVWLLWLVVATASLSCHAALGSDININCFVYHRFGDSRYPSTNITTEEFKKHLEYLKNNDFQVVTLGDALDRLRNKKDMPDKTVVLTIDDGYMSFYEHGMPLLRQYGYVATLFVNSGSVDSPDFMTWKQLQQLQQEGIEIGNHSYSHTQFVNLDPDQQVRQFREDLKKSQQLMGENLGRIPKLYSYPYGEYSHAMISVLKEEGIVGAAAQNSGVISKYSNLMALPRFPVAGKYASLGRFKEKAVMKALPVETLGGPDHVLTGQLQPTLKLRLKEPEVINTRNLQCFVADSRECILQYDEESNNIIMEAKHPLQQRRTLYTITAPSSVGSGGWHWFSYLWIEPTLQ
jgi:peptidoglycan/xylan/chitin deacetylase (PgdA/CDA1 family)